MRVAVNFPYFVPYAGYFRLFAAVDLFVVFDCVPFPRRGYVHRNRLTNQRGRPGWYTLAMHKAPRDTAVRDMRFVADIGRHMRQQQRRFPVLCTAAAQTHRLLQLCQDPAGSGGGAAVPFLLETLRLSNSLLELPFEVVRSSELDFDRDQRGEARVLAILEALGASAYVNAPGGRHLYQRARFRARGLTLDYLVPYEGPSWSILQRLLQEPAAAIRRDIIEQTRLQ